MGLYSRVWRATEGNKTLARQLVASVKKRDKFVSAWWREQGAPIIKKMQAEVAAQIAATPASYWQLTNLKAINRSLGQIIANAEVQFSEALAYGQRGSMDLAVDELKKQFQSAGLGGPSRAFAYEEVLGGISPLTQVITKHFAEDLARKINGEVAFSLTNGDGAFKLSGRMQDALGLSEAQADRIAITELNRSYSYAQQIRGEEMAAENGDLRKIWISSHKPNARETHLQVEADSMDNPLAIDEDFKVDGEDALMPHDARLSAGNTVNCGCTIVYVNASTGPEMAQIIRKNLEEAQS